MNLTAFDPDPALRWLFCMTHPDDEIAMAGWISRLRKLGNHVAMAWTHHTPERELEGRAAALFLGVKGSDLHFFGATDGCVCEEMPALAPKFQALLKQAQPSRVVCGAFEQGHLDHDATHVLVRHAFDGPVFEVPLYHTYLSRLPTANRFAEPDREEILNLTDEEQHIKRSVMHLYPSQRIETLFRLYDLGRRIKGQNSALTTERLRLATHTDFLRPNLPPELAEKVENSAKWKRWCRAYMRFTEAARQP